MPDFEPIMAEAPMIKVKVKKERPGRDRDKERRDRNRHTPKAMRPRRY